MEIRKNSYCPWKDLLDSYSGIGLALVGAVKGWISRDISVLGSNGSDL